MKVLVIGLGYVGTANAVLLASKNEVVCFDLDIDEDDVMELYLAYKQKKMVTSVPTIFAYVSNPGRDKRHWYAPDFSVNSSKPIDIQNFFAKVQTIVNK